MASLVHPKSCPATKSELDLWALPATQMAISKKFDVEFRPVAALTGSTPMIEFCVPASADQYWDLDSTNLEVRMKVSLFKTDNNVKTAVAIADASRKLFSPINNLLHSLFQRIDLELNGKLVTSTSQHAPYRAYIETLLNYDSHAMETHLQGVGWVKDTDFKVSEERNKRVIADDGTIDLYGRLRLDLFNQGRLMIGGLEMKLTLQAHRPDFYFIVDDAKYSVEVEWNHVALFLQCVKLNSPILSAQERALANSPALYPITRVDIKQFVIPAGQGNVPLDTVFAGHQPRRIFAVMVDNISENGSFTTNPYRFQDFGVNYLSCLVNGEAFPSIPACPDFSKKRTKREYHNLFNSLEQMPTRPTLNITPEEFMSGYTIFAWNFAPDHADGCAQHWNVVKRGNMRMELRFATPLTQVITVLVFAEFDSLIQIDKDRNVITDY